MGKLRIAAATVNQTPLNWKNNLENIKSAIEQAREQQADILCLPELCLTGYGCEDLFLSRWMPEKALDLLFKEIVPACKGLAVAIGLPVWLEDRLYNCVCLIEDTQIKGFTAKQHMARDGVHYEPRWFNPWKKGEQTQLLHEDKAYPFGDLTYELKGVKLAFEICEDAWVHEENRPAKSFFEQKIQLILNPSASHFAFGKSQLREALVLNSAERFNCVYVYANLLGNEAGRMIYDGDLLVAQKGKLLMQNRRLSFLNVNVHSVTVDFENPEQSEQLPLADEKDKNTEFSKAEALALFDYMRKSFSSGFVLSLSGGADSSCCAVMVGEMVRRGIQELGVEGFLRKANFGQIWEGQFKDLNLPEKETRRLIVSNLLTTAYQGTKNSSEFTFNSAKELAESLGAQFHFWLIDEEVNSYTKKIEYALGRNLSWQTDDLALQNIQARARSPIIWMLTNIKGGLLLTTSNRSEGDVGYATMDGDTSGSIAPIAAVDKYFVLHWLRWAEEELGYEGLKAVNNLRPSAELRPLEHEQTDEADLMPYRVIVEIERLAIRSRFSPKEVYNTLKNEGLEPNELLKEHIVKFYRLWSRNQWKRERIAPSFHLDDFNVDPRTWCRFPILSGSFQEELEELIMNN
jgi:NAD+ synthase (glutamine-hydrolysing)